MNDGEREFRLRPGKPHVSKPRHDGIALATGFRMLMHYARQSSARRQGSSAGGRRFPHRQRCAVRITYSKNTVRGQWRAHGRYLERESAAHGETGFDAHESDVQVSRKLQDWQANKDQLLWKFIISPEFGDRADLQRLTRDLMLRVDEDLGGSLEWVAVVHRNTEHPHVHIALRGQAADGRALRLSRDYVKRGVREIAEDLCTRQLGFRTALDAAEAERREIPENRFTSLDRLILRNSAAVENGLRLHTNCRGGPRTQSSRCGAPDRSVANGIGRKDGRRLVATSNRYGAGVACDAAGRRPAKDAVRPRRIGLGQTPGRRSGGLAADRSGRRSGAHAWRRRALGKELPLAGINSRQGLLHPVYAGDGGERAALED